MAHRNEYDVAYLLSADGDFVPAVEEAKRFGKRVFAVSAQQGRQLAKAVDAFEHCFCCSKQCSLQLQFSDDGAVIIPSALNGREIGAALQLVPLF